MARPKPTPSRSPAGPHPALLKAQQHLGAGRPADAAAALAALLQREPRNSDALRLAVTAHLGAGRADKAVEFTTRLLSLHPADASLRAAHAGVLILLGRHAEAVPLLEGVLGEQPSNPGALRNMVAALTQWGRCAAAVAAAGRALGVLGPDPAVLNNMAQALHDMGLASEAVEALRTALRHRPGDPSAMQNQAAFLHAVPGAGIDAVLAAHRAFGACVAPATVTPRPPMPARDGPLRAGFISSDLRRHSVSYFVEPLLQHLGQCATDVLVYHTGAQRDEVTSRLMATGVRWRDAAGMPPEALAARIGQDRLHILIELNGLTRGHSLAALARRPAPVQLSYLGYPGGTGCRFIDGRIADAATDPPEGRRPDADPVLGVEGCFVCYRPPEGAPAVGARREGAPITLGCYGALSKYNPALLRLWARVLGASPGTRLVLKAHALSDPETREAVRNRVRDELVAAGVDPERVAVVAPVPDLGGHLAAYHEIDIALDTFPYHGTTTTCEAMLMGVPTVTLVGDRHASRVGLSLNTAIGARELCAPDEGAFVAIAAALARDPDRLGAYRATLRDRMAALSDGRAFSRRFAQVLEEAVGRFGAP